MKTFFDGIFVDSSKLLEEGIEYPMKLEYYKTIEERENVEAKYGIEIVKTEYKDGYTNVERKRVENVTIEEAEVNRILTILRDNEVTPIGIQEVLDDMFTNV